MILTLGNYIFLMVELVVLMFVGIHIIVNLDLKPINFLIGVLTLLFTIIFIESGTALFMNQLNTNNTNKEITITAKEGAQYESGEI